MSRRFHIEIILLKPTEIEPSSFITQTQKYNNKARGLFYFQCLCYYQLFPIYTDRIFGQGRGQK